MKKIEYVKFTEHNDNEGESWNFFFKKSDIKDSCYTALKKFEDFYEDGYTVSIVEYTKEQMLAIEANAEEGYMQSDQEIIITDSDRLIQTCNDAIKNEDYHVFYKGEIQGF